MIPIPEIRRLRSKLLGEVRGFFAAEGFIEVDTPALAPDIIPESSIDVFTVPDPTDSPARNRYLLPSPERWLKRVISAETPRIYQLSHAFRRCEPDSRVHAPEFTMLEWYAAECTYRDELARTTRLLETVAGVPAPVSGAGEASGTPSPGSPLVSTIREACLTYGDVDIESATTRDALASELERIGLSTTKEDTWAELFHRLLIGRVEPAIESHPAIVLIDYPWQVRCLARRKPGTQYRERWELYLRGIEVANCFTEETDPDQLTRLFAHESEVMEARNEAIDTSFPASQRGTPHPCSGVALGFDRLLMAIAGIDRIEAAAYFIDEIR